MVLKMDRPFNGRKENQHPRVVQEDTQSDRVTHSGGRRRQKEAGGGGDRDAG